MPSYAARSMPPLLERGLTRCWLGLSLILLSACLAQPRAESWLPEMALPAVTVEYLDSLGNQLRSGNGTLLRQGLVVPLSALAGATEVRAYSRDGKRWATTQLISFHAPADLALLSVSDIPSYAIDVPRGATFTKNSEVVLVRGPRGAGAESVTATAFDKFSVRGPDFLAISEGLPSGAPGFRADGVLLGVCFDLSEGGHLLDYLVTTASVGNLIADRGEAIPLRDFAAPPAPAYRDRTSSQGLAFRGALLVASGHPEDARSFLDQALRRDRGNASAHFWIGRADYDLGQHETAAGSFERAAQADPEFHLAWHMAGAALSQAGRYEEALAMYDRALEVYPESAMTYCNRGTTLYHRMRYDEAHDAFAMAIELDPSYPLPYFNLAMLMRDRGRAAEAESIYVKLRQHDPTWAERLRRALDRTGS